MARPRGASKRSPTATREFGAGSRESHDASAFYARFTPPALSDDETVHPPFELSIDEALVCGDARALDLPEASVALVVTSPPYFAGKAYETELERDGIPASYLEYLQMLHDVFARCVEVMEPGGRIAVNVANLGRKPYCSLSADVSRILQDLGLLLRGEVIWAKAEGASGSCAWGSFKQATNPALRDITERVVIASKGRFDRARPLAQRRSEGLPWRSTTTTDEFMEATLDLWRIPPESARRVQHPAPFPVELPMRLIDLYTYENDLVLDPFLGSGSAAVAAVRRGRRFAGYDLDETYVRIAKDRVIAEQERMALGGTAERPALPLRLDDGEESDGEYLVRALDTGSATKDIAAEVVTAAGFTIVDRNKKFAASGSEVSIVADDATGGRWHFDVTGAFTATRGGLARTDAVWRAVGRVSVLSRAHPSVAHVVLTSHLPPRRSPADKALRALGPDLVFDAIEMLSNAGQHRLRAYARGDRTTPLPGFW